MNLVEKLDADFKSALKSRDSEKLSILRLVRSNIKNLEITKQGEASDEDVTEILQREIKQHKESIDANQKAQRQEEVERLEKEVAILQAYLPEALSNYKSEDNWVSVDPTSNLKFGEVSPRHLKNIRTHIYI